MKSPWRARADNELLVVTLYERPLDYPEHFVLRAWYVRAGQQPEPEGEPVLFYGALPAQRWMGALYPWMAWAERDEGDEPQIVGSWF